MPSRLPAFCLGYHGCSAEVALKLLSGESSLAMSTNDYDWLGAGVYFWENDPQRAWEWARHRKYADPAVIGAVIDYGTCLNLLERENVEFLSLAFETLAATSDPIPKNEEGFPGDQDFVKRELDCAVVNLACDMAKANGAEFDTVRAMFPEGKAAYAGAGFRAKTHVQLCVRDTRLIKGYFLPLDPSSGEPFDWDNYSC